MTTEDKLRNFILTRYKSVREFVQTVNIPYSTMDSIFRRGIGNSSVTNVIKICTALNISADALTQGEIVPLDNSIETETTDVDEILDRFKNRLLTYGLTIQGQPVDRQTIREIIDAIEVGVEIVKRKNKYQDNKKDVH